MQCGSCDRQAPTAAPAQSTAILDASAQVTRRIVCGIWWGLSRFYGAAYVLCCAQLCSICGIICIITFFHCAGLSHVSFFCFFPCTSCACGLGGLPRTFFPLHHAIHTRTGFPWNQWDGREPSVNPETLAKIFLIGFGDHWTVAVKDCNGHWVHRDGSGTTLIVLLH